MQHLSGNWADVLVWVIILTGLVACAGFIVRLGEPRQPAPPIAATDTVVDQPEAEGSRRLGPDREWALIVRHATQGLDRSSTLTTLHADAARKIAAAEHAFDRLPKRVVDRSHQRCSRRLRVRGHDRRQCGEERHDGNCEDPMHGEIP